MEKITTIAVLEQDREKAKEMAQIYKLKMYEFFTLMIAFFDENREFLNPKNKEENSNNITEILENKINKNLTKQTNRLIGFIKKQDEKLLEIEQKIQKETKQILFKVIPIEEQELSEYNPLFEDYDRVIFILKKILEKKGVKVEDLEKEIEKELGGNFLREYQESSDKVKTKNFLS